MKAVRFKALLEEGIHREPKGWIRTAVIIIAVGLTIFEVWLAVLGRMDPYQYTTIFYPVVLAVTFLLIGSSQRARKEPTWLDIGFACLALAIEVFFFINIEHYLQRIPLFNPLTAMETVVGIVLVLLTLEATRRVLGPSLTIIVIVFMLYTFFGHLLPGAYSHRLITLNHFLDDMVYTINGIFGTPLAVAATYVFLFVLFGAFYTQAGGGDFFFKLAASLAGRTAGGPAKVAVISSGLFGTISGSPTSDVVTTGSITIPMMKRMGFKPVFAGGVEAASCTGGSVLPPIMGTAAFLMAEYAGIEYVKIAIAATIPALLYYLGIFLQVHYRAKKEGMRGMSREEAPPLRQVWKEGWMFVIPLIVLVWGLLQGYTPAYIAVIASASVIVVSWFNPKGRIGIRQIIATCEEAIVRMTPVTVACAAAGMVIDGIMLTGLGGKFGALIFGMTGGSVFFTLLATAVLCTILGMGMPVSSAYILTAVLAAPILINLGVPAMNAHLFIVYYSCLSAITPPVAVAAYAASSIAKANPVSIGFNACKLSFVAFILPFMFVYEPALLLQGGIGMIVAASATAALGVIALAAAIEGWMIGLLRKWERVLLLAAGLWLIYPGWVTDLIGIIAILWIILLKIKQERDGAAIGKAASQAAANQEIPAGK
ncbi:TRAP transporter fused permease subunit [Bacillaceae bacterium]